MVHRMSFTIAVLVLLTLIVPGVVTAVIDFETTPVGGIPTDDTELTEAYTVDSTIVAFGFDTDGLDGIIQIDTSAVFEDRIPPDWEPGETSSAYSSGSGVSRFRDPDFTLLGLGGTWMIRKPVGHDITQNPFVMEFSSVLPSDVSGEIWDLDARPAGGGDAEEYTVTALDTLDQVIDTIVSPIGVSETSPGTLDGRPWPWAFEDSPTLIKKITILQTRAPTKGFAFDNFRIAANPAGVPPSPSCRGTFALYQNIPNPFSLSTVIHYGVPEVGREISLRVYDVGGRLVRTLVEGTETGGMKTVAWDGRDFRGRQVTPGIYFYQLASEDYSQTRRMVFIR